MSEPLKCADCGGHGGPFYQAVPDGLDVCPDCATERLRPFLRQGYRVELTPPVVHTFTITGVKDPE